MHDNPAFVAFLDKVCHNIPKNFRDCEKMECEWCYIWNEEMDGSDGSGCDFRTFLRSWVEPGGE